MEILQGLMDRQVLQRNGKNLCETKITGRCMEPGHLEIKVTRNKRSLVGFNWKALARVRGGEFSCMLKGIPVGGPYQIALRLVSQDKKKLLEQTTFKEVLVGDVWILAGQSNMEGLGYLKDAAKPDPRVRAFTMDDRWRTAKDPIHKLHEAIDPVHHQFDPEMCGDLPRSKHVGTGPGIAFGKRMLQLSGVPQGSIACAHGGTSTVYWDPALNKPKTSSLYGALLRRFHQNGGNIAGVVWHQGCSDAQQLISEGYTRRMKKFVAALRRDCGDPKLPVICAQIATYHWLEAGDREIRHWNAVKEQQRALPDRIERITVAPTIDLSLDDLIHISGADQQRLGRRLADAGWALIRGAAGGVPPIKLSNVKSVRDPLTGNINIKVSFTRVAGSLQATGKPLGFALVTPANKFYDAICRTNLKGNQVILRTIIPAGEKHNLSLYYGFGCAPCCNITDEKDRSIPAFGPYSIKW